MNAIRESKERRLYRLLKKIAVNNIAYDSKHYTHNRLDRICKSVGHDGEDLDAMKDIHYVLSKNDCFKGFDGFLLGIEKNDTLFICDDCGDVEHLDGSSFVENIGNVCEGCLESGRYAFDDKSNEFILEEDSVEVLESAFGRASHYTIHKDSVHKYAFFCDSCENHYDVNMVSCYEHINGDAICEGCSGNYYYHESDNMLHDEPENYDQDDKGLLSNTDDSWTINPSRKNQNDKFLGIEIETYIGNESILENLLDDSINRNGTSKSDLEKGENFYCLKEDGSLDKNHGVEIVFHHDSPKNIKRNLKTFFEKNNRGISAWDKGTGYGIHIHLEKSSLSIEQRERILSFFLWSSNHNFLKFIARRSPNSYWSFDYAEECPRDGYTIKKHAKNLIEKGTEKYRAVYSNKKTLEFRMFRSTTKLESILVYVDFVLCLASFCKRSDSLEYNDFIDFAISKRKHFENLATLLEKKFRTTGEN